VKIASFLYSLYLTFPSSRLQGYYGANGHLDRYGRGYARSPAEKVRQGGGEGYHENAVKDGESV